MDTKTNKITTWRERLLSDAVNHRKEFTQNDSESYLEALDNTRVLVDFDKAYDLALASIAPSHREMIKEYYQQIDSMSKTKLMDKIGKKYGVSKTTVQHSLYQVMRRLLYGSNVYLFSEGIDGYEQMLELRKNLNDDSNALAKTLRRLIYIRKEVLRLGAVMDDPELRNAIEIIKSKIKPSDIIDENSDISELYNGRVANALKRNNINTIKDLLNAHDEEIMDRQSIGSYTLYDIDKILNNYGLERYFVSDPLVMIDYMGLSESTKKQIKAKFQMKYAQNFAGLPESLVSYHLTNKAFKEFKTTLSRFGITLRENKKEQQNND